MLTQKERNDIFDNMDNDILIKIIRLEALKKKKKLKLEVINRYFDKNHRKSKIVEYIEKTLNICLPIDYDEMSEYSKYILVIRFKEYYPEHDGYCSDAGEDTGKIKESEKRIKLSKKQLNVIKKEKIDFNKTIPYYIVNSLKLFNEEDYIRCCIGSGYCGYTGFKKYIFGKLKKDINT